MYVCEFMWMFSWCVDKKVLTWGRGTSGQLGHGNLVNSLEPKSVDVLGDLNITHVSAGWNHSGFVTGLYSLFKCLFPLFWFKFLFCHFCFWLLESGQLFTCGDGSFGQLGLGDYESHRSPMKVSHFASRHVEQIACGMRHSIALLKGKYHIES